MGFLSFQREHLETEMHKKLHILTVHENYLHKTQTYWLWIKPLYECCYKMHFWCWDNIKYILETDLLPYLSFSDIINSVRFCWNSVLLFWHLKQYAFISKTVASIMTLQKTSFLIHIFLIRAIRSVLTELHLWPPFFSILLILYLLRCKNGSLSLIIYISLSVKDNFRSTRKPAPNIKQWSCRGRNFTRA